MSVYRQPAAPLTEAARYEATIERFHASCDALIRLCERLQEANARGDFDEWFGQADDAPTPTGSPSR